MYGVSSAHFFRTSETIQMGGCPVHLKKSLQPHLIKSGPCKGDLVLRAQFWKYGNDQKRLCFFKTPFPRGLWQSLPENLKLEYCDLRHSLPRNAANRVAADDVARAT